MKLGIDIKKEIAATKNLTKMKEKVEEVEEVEERSYRLLKTSNRCYCKGGRIPCRKCDSYGYCCRDPEEFDDYDNGCCEECGED